MKNVVWAHRGASAYCPENTIPAFQGAIDMKADGVELDIHASYDGQIVVSHDGTLARCGGGNVNIEAVSYDEIKKHPVPGRFPKEYPDVTAPLLSEVFELLRPHNMLINVEIKSGWSYDNIKKLVAMTHDMKMQELVLYSSFDHRTLHCVRTLDASCRLGALYGGEDIPKAAEYAKALRFTELHPYYSCCRKENYITDASALGINVNPWTVDDEDVICELVKLGCHGIITNKPDVARKVIDSLK